MNTDAETVRNEVRTSIEDQIKVWREVQARNDAVPALLGQPFVVSIDARASLLLRVERTPEGSTMYFVSSLPGSRYVCLTRTDADRLCAAVRAGHPAGQNAVVLHVKDVPPLRIVALLETVEAIDGWHIRAILRRGGLL